MPDTAVIEEVREETLDVSPPPTPPISTTAIHEHPKVILEGRSTDRVGWPTSANLSSQPGSLEHPLRASAKPSNQELPPSGNPESISLQPLQAQHAIRNQSILQTEEVVPVDDLRHVMEVTIIKPGMSKAMIGDTPVDYTAEALRASVPLWEGAACFCDHWNKSVRNIAGVYFSPWYDENGGVRARLRFTDSALYYMVRQVMQDRQLGLPVPDIGISADFIVRGSIGDNSVEVTEISQVISADIVFAPAAGGSFDRVLNSVRQQLGITEEGVDWPTSANPSSAAGNADKRIRDLQSTADKLRAQVRNQESETGRLEHLLQQAQAALDQAVTRYRAGILREHPEIPEHMVTGSTVEEVDASLEQARGIVDAVKQHLEEQVPAGAPARQGVDVEALSPREKIEYGVSHGKARR